MLRCGLIPGPAQLDFKLLAEIGEIRVSAWRLTICPLSPVCDHLVSLVAHVTPLGASTLSASKLGASLTAPPLAFPGQTHHKLPSRLPSGHFMPRSLQRAGPPRLQSKRVVVISLRGSNLTVVCHHWTLAKVAGSRFRPKPITAAYGAPSGELTHMFRIRSWQSVAM